jgi:uncharacterized coiled-coil DUF342 family protein
MNKIREYRLFEEMQEIRPGRYQPFISIREVWYDENGVIDYINEPTLSADYVSELKQDIEMLRKALDTEVLKLEDYRYAVEEF